MKVSARNFHDGQLKDRKRQRLLTKLEKNQKVKGVKLILRICDDNNLLHIVSPREKDMLLARHKAIILVGLAKNMDGAHQGVQEIAEYVINAHGNITGELIDKELDIHWT